MFLRCNLLLINWLIRRIPRRDLRFDLTSALNRAVLEELGREYSQTAVVGGSNNYVNQSNVIASGDVVGGDLSKGRDGKCPYCGSS